MATHGNEHQRPMYKFIKEVGKGASGVAHLMEDQEGQQYIMKSIDIEKLLPQQIKHAINEIKVLSELRHPYIVRYRESFIEGNSLRIVMDFCAGGDLNQRIQKQRKVVGRQFKESQIVTWMAEACIALKDMHSRHILHRDIKSHNIFLDAEGDRLRMGDFGICKVLDNTLAVVHSFVGTPYYMSPEIVVDQEYSWPADIWALGCVLYELCTFKTPLAGTSTLPDIIVKLADSEPIPPIPSGYYSDELISLCSAMLNKKPHCRPSAKQILLYPIIQRGIVSLLSAHSNTEPSPGNGSQGSSTRSTSPCSPPSPPSPFPPVLPSSSARLVQGPVSEPSPPRLLVVPEKGSSSRQCQTFPGDGKSNREEAPSPDILRRVLSMNLSHKSDTDCQALSRSNVKRGLGRRNAFSVAKEEKKEQEKGQGVALSAERRNAVLVHRSESANSKSKKTDSNTPLIPPPEMPPLLISPAASNHPARARVETTQPNSSAKLSTSAQTPTPVATPVATHSTSSRSIPSTVPRGPGKSGKGISPALCTDRPSENRSENRSENLSENLSVSLPASRGRAPEPETSTSLHAKTKIRQSERKEELKLREAEARVDRHKKEQRRAERGKPEK